MGQGGDLYDIRRQTKENNSWNVEARENTTSYKSLTKLAQVQNDRSCHRQNDRDFCQLLPNFTKYKKSDYHFRLSFFVLRQNLPYLSKLPYLANFPYLANLPYLNKIDFWLNKNRLTLVYRKNDRKTSKKQPTLEPIVKMYRLVEPGKMNQLNQRYERKPICRTKAKSQ